MKTILCYGDSNTWGYDAQSNTRFDRDSRWTGVLQNELGDDYYIIEAGLNSRTTKYEDPEVGHCLDGLATLPLMLATHAQLDVVIIFLGTNDLFFPIQSDADGAARAVGELVDLINTKLADYQPSSPNVLVLIPPPFSALSAELAIDSPHGMVESARFSETYQKVLAGKACTLLDLAAVATSSSIDGIHFERREHIKIGQAVAKVVRGLV